MRPITITDDGTIEQQFGGRVGAVSRDTPEEMRRLIEAAPDMLAALQAMLAYYSGGRINNPAQRAAYRAVSQATGKPLPDWVPPHE